MQFDYPAIEGVEPELLLVTHEHRDHNGVEAIGGSPAVIRSTAGTLESPVGEVVAVASEHDEVAGTQRGPNTIFVFTLDGLRIAHFGDFGQTALRDEQADAIGQVDLAFVPVGGRADDRRRPGARARRPDRRALGRADALPDAADRLPRDRRMRSWSCSGRGRAARRDALRHRGAAERRRPGRRRPAGRTAAG